MEVFLAPPWRSQASRWGAELGPEQRVIERDLQDSGAAHSLTPGIKEGKTPTPTHILMHSKHQGCAKWMLLFSPVLSGVQGMELEVHRNAS